MSVALPCLLICEDDPLYRRTLGVVLAGHFRLQFTDSAPSLFSALTAHQPPPAAVLLDLSLGPAPRLGQANLLQLSGMQALRRLFQMCPNLPVLIHSGFCEAALIVEAMRLGAVDYVPKAAPKAELIAQIHRVIGARSAEQPAPSSDFPMLGESQPMQHLRRQIEALRPFFGHVIVQGESGVGKELVARALARPGAPFVPVDCATLNPSTADSLLFGHVRGAFTGAATAHAGLLQAASGGVLYFDEVANLHLEVQAKLLRALQEQEIVPLGSTQARPVDIMVVCATHANLAQRVREQTFRHDLLARLQTFTLSVPPLRQRADDIPSLLNHFLCRAWRRAYGNVGGMPRPTEALLARLKVHPWPGNVRQLAQLAVGMLAAAQGPWLDEATLPAEFAGTAASDAPMESTELPKPPEPAPVSYRDSMLRHEAARLRQEYATVGGNVSELARRLRCDRSRLHHKLVRLGLHTAKPYGR